MPRGGSRPGAGRKVGSKDTKPRVVETKSVQLAARVSPWVAAWVKAQPSGISATITKALILLMTTIAKEDH